MTTGAGFQLVPDGYDPSQPRVPDNEGTFCLLPPFCSFALYSHACFVFSLTRLRHVSQNPGKPDVHPRRHSSEGSPAWMQVVERRLEQAAEESRKAEAGCETNCDFPRSAEVTRLSFPLCGNVLNKPLDSGLRQNDDGGIPACQTRHALPSLHRLAASRPE